MRSIQYNQGSPFNGRPVPRVAQRDFQMPTDPGGGPGMGPGDVGNGYIPPSQTGNDPNFNYTTDPNVPPFTHGPGGNLPGGGTGYTPFSTLGAFQPNGQPSQGPPIPTGNTGSPFITPVTGPPTYQSLTGQVGDYGGPYDYWGQGGASANRDLSGGAAFGGYLEQLMHPGMDAATQNALEQSGQGAVRANFAGQQEQAARNAAQSGNSAGLAGATALMARNQASQLGQQALQNKLAETAFAQQNKNSALGGLSGLYQGETNYMSNLLGARAAMSQQPFSKQSNSQGVTTGSSSTGGFSI